MKKFKVFITVALTLVISVGIASALTISVDELKELLTESEVSFGAFPGPEVYMDVTVYGTVTNLEKTTVVAPGVTTFSTTTLSLGDSGTTYLIASSTGSEFVLPAVAGADGVTYRFIVTGALKTATTTIFSAAGDDIEGTLMVAGVVKDCDDADQISISASLENVGDFVEIISDGTNWYPLASGFLTALSVYCQG